MHTLPKFEIYDDDKEPEGVFIWGSSRDELFERYYEASDCFYLGDIAEAKAILKEILAEDAHFIDAHVLLGNIELEEGNLKRGFDHHKKAVDIGNQIIPNSFEGRIRWAFTENRPFLRALNARAIDYLDEDRQEESIRILQQLLFYSPDDNQGVRFLIGDLHFLTGNTKEAETFYKQNLDYPPYLYSYALLQFSRGKYYEAATLFRKGIIENIYISDLLRGKLPIITYEIWHGSNFETPEVAYPYLEATASLWAQFPDALGLLQFIHIADPSSHEIEEVYLLKSELYFSDINFGEPGVDEARKEILKEIDQIKKRITDQSSKQIIRSWKSEPGSFYSENRK